MNRLVIIGNGFDLAHGLPTKYCDFIDDYWKKVVSNTGFPKEYKGYSIYYEDNMIKILLQLYVNSYEMNSITEDYLKISSFQNLNNIFDNWDGDIIFKNDFFRIINSRNSIQNWVDIEDEYYKLLKECLKEPSDNSLVKKLNQEFEAVKQLLEEYLQKDISEKYDFTYLNDANQTLSAFNVDNRIRRKNSFLLEFDDKEQNYLNDWISEYQKQSPVRGIYIVKNLFLNFNYTPAADMYISEMNNSSYDDYGESTHIQIHGKLRDSRNPINFGFGDEMDDDYKAIEKKDDNEYLKNIKSFQYLQNSNYKNMLSFIESDKFQVYIMGHSCGLSDRILLNKIFEHTNCKSIKVFYHKNGDTDNYTDIVQNISRHFNKKEMMREKIVNKTLCEPLPQIKLPLK